MTSGRSFNELIFIALSVITFDAWSPFSAYAQVQVSITARKDNTLYESSTGSLSNGVGEHFFAGKNGLGSIRRALVAFDIAGNVPSGAMMTDVVLTLHMSQSQLGSRTVELHRVLADWGEANSVAIGGGGGEGGGGPADTGDATWIHRFFNTIFWANAGGDFSAAASASQSVGAIGFYSWGSTPEMLQDVQAWLDTPSTNFGWLLLGVESTSSTSKRFDTRENIDTTLRPKLTIAYTPTVGITDDVRLPTKFTLYQNHPNPFNPTTTIQYDLPDQPDIRLAGQSEVVLKIYDMLGQEVKTLVNEKQIAGQKSVSWDGRADSGQLVSSGIYIYRFMAGGRVQSKKMTFVK